MNTTSKIEITSAKDIPYPSYFPPQEFHQSQSRITLDQLTGLREVEIKILQPERRLTCRSAIRSLETTHRDSFA